MKKVICCCLVLIILFTLISYSSISKTESHPSGFYGEKLTEYHPSGFDGKKLYVNTDGKTLVFESREAGTGSLTRNILLDTFSTQTKIETVIWDVYSTKEYPDLSYVLVISGTNSSWTYCIFQGTP